ncbi:LacI family DNA-binding transcriptional regulator [Celeribacter sp.]|uniref:LacI family DNA-binding transcriptional regulator n=1 Tax=Celeribacter sp. TaxID=1890673 RepID=UPI003A911ACB
MKRPKIKDLAEVSGVSVATVDRVLNGRQSVRAATAMRVYEAAERIGYHATPLLQKRIGGDVPKLHFGLLLPNIEPEFYTHFKQEAERAASQFNGANVRLTVNFIAAADPDDVSRALAEMGEKVDAIGMIAVDHADVTHEIEVLRDKGIPAYAILSEVGQGVREAFVGTNNLKVGRTAASMLARALPVRPEGAPKYELALFVGGHRWHGHELRETGFRTWLRQNRSDISVLETMVNLDIADFTFEATLSVMARHPRLAGIYCAGGGREGVIRAVREEKKAGQVDIVANEFAELTRHAMTEGLVSMVIDTPAFDIMNECYRLALQVASEGLGSSMGQHFIRMQLVTSESY